MWRFAGAVIGALLLMFGVGRTFSKRRRGTKREIDVGALSEAWLAEHRGSRHDQ